MKIYYLVFLCILGTVSGGPPEWMIEDDIEVNSEEAPGEEPEYEDKVLGYNVEAYEYSLPEGMIRERNYTNDWTWCLRYPAYSLEFRYYCPYSIEKGETEDTIKRANIEKCWCTVQLWVWIEKERREIRLDTYRMKWRKGTEFLTERSVIILEPEGNTHNIALAMTNGECKKAQYTMETAVHVRRPVINDIDCNEVEALKKDSNQWTKINLPKEAVDDHSGVSVMVPASNDISDDGYYDDEEESTTETAAASTSNPQALIYNGYENSVISSKYRLPPDGPFKEFPHASHWVPMKKHLTHSLHFFYYCPYELEPLGQLIVRMANWKECRSVLKLRKYSYRLKRDVTLDTFRIKETSITRKVVNFFHIIEDTSEKTVLAFNMANGKCREKVYEVQEDASVEVTKIDVPCNSD